MAMYKICSYCRKKYEYDGECVCNGAEKAKQIRRQYYDKYVRKSEENKKYDSFYHSKQWERMTEHIKNRYNSLCVMCLMENGDTVPYDVVHHIYEIKTDAGWKERLNEDLLITLCHDCHGKQHPNYTQDKIDSLIHTVDRYKELYGGGE